MLIKFIYYYYYTIQAMRRFTLKKNSITKMEEKKNLKINYLFSTHVNLKKVKGF